MTFYNGKSYFSRLGGSQDEHKRFRKAPKRHLKSFKTSKERVPKMDPPKNVFEVILEAKWTPKWTPQKKTKTGPKMEPNLEMHQMYRNGSRNANTVNCRCRCRYKSCQINKRKELRDFTSTCDSMISYLRKTSSLLRASMGGSFQGRPLLKPVGGL